MSYEGINPDSKLPKYLQLVELIIKDIMQGVYKLMDRLPSINEISAEYDVSRDTAERAFKELRRRGVIKSIQRKGYFIARATFDHKINIAFVTNRIPDFKRNIYEIFTCSIEKIAHVDVYVYNYDIKKFETTISGHLNEYDYFVVIPYFETKEDDKKAISILESIQPGKLILLDRNLPGIKNEHSCFVQDFELDMRKALIMLNDEIQKYEKHYLVFPEDSKHPNEVQKGFTVFCKMHNLSYEVVSDLKGLINKGCTYTILDDYDLVLAIEEARAKNLEAGKDIGIISYNESPLKQILLEGVTVISTDWETMGKYTAEVIINNEARQETVPFKIFKRKTL